MISEITSRKASLELFNSQKQWFLILFHKFCKNSTVHFVHDLIYVNLFRHNDVMAHLINPFGTEFLKICVHSGPELILQMLKNDSRKARSGHYRIFVNVPERVKEKFTVMVDP